MVFRFKAALFRLMALTQSKKDFLANQYKMEPEVIEEIAGYDPSPNNAYTAWLCKVVKEGKSVSELAALKEPLKKFMKLINSPEFPKEKRDIGKYSPEDLLNLVGSERAYRLNLSQKEIEKLIMKEGLPGAKMIWNSGGFKMWHVTNPKYARFLSSNTSWCTAQPTYSVSYCEKGGLYPVYFHDKPIAQGHVGFKGELTFLNKEDNNVSLLDPLIMGMLETIQLPVMQDFKKKIVNDNNIENAVEVLKDDPEKLAELKNLIWKEGTPRNILSFIEMAREVWLEGLERLLDHPALLWSAVRGLGNKARLIREQSPELAQEIIYELRASDMLPEGSEGSKVLFQLAKEPSDSDLKSMMITFIDDHADVGSDWPRLFNLVTSEIEASPEDEPTYAIKDLQRFLEANEEYPSAKPSILAFWKKFKKDQWPTMESIIGDDPDYKQRISDIRTSIKIPVAQMRVLPGPDYPNKGEDKSGVITEVEKSMTQSGSRLYKVQVQWDNGETESLDIYPGHFPLRQSTAQSTKLVKVPIKRGEHPLEVGDKVVPNRHSSRYGREEEAVVTKIEGDPADDEVLIYVRWPNGEEDGGWYDWRFDRLVEEVDTYTPPLSHQDLKVGSIFTLEGRSYVVRSGDEEGKVWVPEMRDIIRRVISSNSDAAVHDYVEEVAGETYPMGKMNPEISLEGMILLINALINKLGE